MDMVWSFHSIDHIIYHVYVLVLGGSLIFFIELMILGIKFFVIG